MFRHEKLFVGTDVIDREALCKRLTDNGATIVSNVGEQDSIHIFNSFEGGVFEDCVKKGCRVIGVPCIQETLRSGKALPRASHPIYSRVMEGLVVSGDIVEEKAKLKNYVNQMNGTWADELTGNTQYFITNEPGSMHYMWALEFGSNIVQPSWITESWEKRTLSNVKSHLLPPLSGCVVSVTGLSTATRATVQNLVTHYGGKYSQQLSRKVTHLLCDKPKGRKYVTALTWGVHVVTTNWLFDSVNMKGTADVSRYELPAVPADLDGLGGEALYVRSPYARTSGYTPLSSAARSRLNNYANAPILIRRHRNPIGANYTPLFSMPNPHSHLSSHSHQPVFAQTTQIQSGSSSHSANTSLHPSMRQSNSIMLHQNRYTSSSRARERDKEVRANMDRYREMFDQLTGLLRMCEDVIQRCGPLNDNINNNNSTSNNNNNNNNNNDSDIINNNNNLNNIKLIQSNIDTLTNLYHDFKNIAANAEILSKSTATPTPDNNNTNNNDTSNNPTNNTTNNTNNNITNNETSTDKTNTITTEPDLDMESEDEPATSSTTTTTTTSSEQEK